MTQYHIDEHAYAMVIRRVTTTVTVYPRHANDAIMSQVSYCKVQSFTGELILIMIEWVVIYKLLLL